jgi:hypothetical protein
MSHAEDQMDRVFVAHPASFDFAWVQRLLVTYLPDVGNKVFSWRTLDLRSAGWALDPSQRMTDPVRTHKSEIPHHALYDAIAQARDLADIINARGVAAAILEPDIDPDEPTDYHTLVG